MTTRDRELIDKRLDYLNGIIKANHKLPKDQRDEKSIADARKRILVINSWLKPEPKKTEVAKPQISKAEYRQKLKQVLGASPETEFEIEISSMTALDTAWPEIKDKIFQGKMMIKAPTFIKEEIKRRLRKYRIVKPKGFR
jgi:hypothetical protein